MHISTPGMIQQYLVNTIFQQPWGVSEEFQVHATMGDAVIRAKCMRGIKICVGDINSHELTHATAAAVNAHAQVRVSMYLGLDRVCATWPWSTHKKLIDKMADQFEAAVFHCRSTGRSCLHDECTRMPLKRW